MLATHEFDLLLRSCCAASRFSHLIFGCSRLASGPPACHAAAAAAAAATTVTAAAATEIPTSSGIRRILPWPLVGDLTTPEPVSSI
ncbi:MAG: hypothetical protein ACRDU4_04840 [Mycobacterium sp.]